MSFFPLVDVLNLVMYPDRHADQSSAGVRHKALLSLKGFSGLQVLNKMDKHFNVIVIITTEEVIPLSFETIDQRAEWLALLQGHFGKGESESMMLISEIHKARNPISTSNHVLFYSEHFPKIFKDSLKDYQRPDKCFQTFPENFRRFPKILEDN